MDTLLLEIVYILVISDAIPHRSRVLVHDIWGEALVSGARVDVLIAITGSLTVTGLSQQREEILCLIHRHVALSTETRIVFIFIAMVHSDLLQHYVNNTMIQYTCQLTHKLQRGIFMKASNRGAEQRREESPRSTW